MVTTIGMIVSFALGAIVGIKAVQLGLKYQMQIKEDIMPEFSPIKDTVQEFASNKATKQEDNQVTEMISDLLGDD